MEGLIIFIKFDLQKDKVTQLRTSYTVLVAVRARTPAIGLSFQQVGHRGLLLLQGHPQR